MQEKGKMKDSSNFCTPVDGSEWENHLIMRFPPEITTKVQQFVERDSHQTGHERLSVNFDHNLRTGTIQFEHNTMRFTLNDLPCIIEMMKTLDNKTVYKIADLCQMIVVSAPKHEPRKEEPEELGDSKLERYQWPDGICPPLKNVRRKRFRKIKKKRYMDVADVERELKRLLRSDLEAVSVRWEVVAATEAEDVEMKQPQPTNVEKNEEVASQHDDLYEYGLSLSESEDEQEADGSRTFAQRHSDGGIAPSAVDTLAAFIFIGGIPRSGTTLMRAMLDAHPEVRCGEETRVIPRILALRAQWKKSEKEWKRLREAGVSDEVLNSAVSAFIVNIIVGHGAQAPRLCNKDPFTLKSTTDGRATVHSIISRKVTITGFDLNNFRQCLQKWNAGIQIMYEQCNAVGRAKCLPVYYEQLVLHPERVMKRLLNFLNLPWNESVLHHEMFIGKDISLSKVERSTDQVIKPLNLDALNKWVGQVPEDVVNQMDEIAPMLRVLGYDPNANPPNYGQADEEVLKKTEQLHREELKWNRKAQEVLKDEPRLINYLRASLLDDPNCSPSVHPTKGFFFGFFKGGVITPPFILDGWRMNWGVFVQQMSPPPGSSRMSTLPPFLTLIVSIAMSQALVQAIPRYVDRIPRQSAGGGDTPRPSPSPSPLQNHFPTAVAANSSRAAFASKLVPSTVDDAGQIPRHQPTVPQFVANNGPLIRAPDGQFVLASVVPQQQQSVSFTHGQIQPIGLHSSRSTNDSDQLSPSVPPIGDVQAEVSPPPDGPTPANLTPDTLSPSPPASPLDKSVDLDGDGALSLGEVQYAAFVHHGLSSSVVENLFNEVDHNKDGYLNSPEFNDIRPLVLAKAENAALRYLQNVDTDHNGLLSLSEAQSYILKEYGISNRDVERIWRLVVPSVVTK
uniref:Protein-tyrosine sulfotransferase n=1 Tax=Globodera rostochiensis TaxID=31243 RepID=A0A914HCL4_GLORO